MSMLTRNLVVCILLLGWPGPLIAETVRPAVWAGKFYPASTAALRRTIEDLTRQAARTPAPLPAGGHLKALILPHAGYAYSGLTAAHAHQVLAGAAYSKVILMGPDHRAGFADGAVSDATAFATPLGHVPLHIDARRLCDGSRLFRPVPVSDRQEHSLEVVLPFLQTDLASFQMVPVVLGPCDPKAVAGALAPLVDADTLVVASADLSHYLPYEQAVARDRETIRAILDLKAALLLGDDNRTCGRYPLAVLLKLAKRFHWRPILLNYANSGDTAGDRKAVVGYAAVAFYGEKEMQSTPSQLTPQQGQVLLQLARRTLTEKLGGGKTDIPQASQPTPLEDPALQRTAGVFVTLKINDNLRGCIGTLTGREPLVKEVPAYALHAALDDPRFKPLTASELKQVLIEVSVLTEPRPLDYTDAGDLIAKLQPNVDGVILRKGYRSATFLPQVWEQLPRPESFLNHLCLKAGLDGEAWRESKLEVETYQVQYFEESH